MAERLLLSDVELDQAGRALATAASVLYEQPLQHASFDTAISPADGLRIAAVLRSLGAAAAALSDAARTGANATAELMDDSGNLEALLARALPGGFALSETETAVRAR